MFVGKVFGKLISPCTKVVRVANKTAKVTSGGVKSAKLTVNNKIDIICEKSSAANTVRKFLRKIFSPVTNLKATYSDNKQQGKLKALKAVLRKNGYGGPIGAVCGYGLGWATYPFVPGTGTIGATLGYGIGRGVEVVAKKAINLFV